MAERLPATLRRWSAGRPAACALLLAIPWLLTGCSELAYYGQAIHGHWSVMGQRQSVDDALRDAGIPQPTRDKLQLSRELLAYAETQLGLPGNGSYRSYVQLDRDFVVWNVFAAPELSLEARQWCVPVAGCVVYRGWFDRRDALEHAERLQHDGTDSFVGGATAYSTLGWFSDPLLSTFLNGSDWRMASLLFHELAHQKLYVAGDSTFNESFASAVEREATRRWLADRGDRTALTEAEKHWKHRDARLARIDQARQRLQAVYDSNLPDPRKRELKAAIYAGLNQELDWTDAAGREPNNAALAALQAYHELLPAFETLLAEHDHDLPAFYAAVGKLAELPMEQRHQALIEQRPVTLAKLEPE